MNISPSIQSINQKIDYIFNNAEPLVVLGEP